MQQFFSLLSWRLFTAQHVSGVFPPTIRSSVTAVAASGFTFVSWWWSCCVCGRPCRPAGTQGRSGRVQEIWPPPGIDPRTVQPEVSRYTDWDIPSPSNESNNRQDRQGTEACLCNHCCSGKAITYSESVLVALVIQHAMRMRHFVICGPSGCTFLFNP